MPKTAKAKIWPLRTLGIKRYKYIEPLVHYSILPFHHPLIFKSSSQSCLLHIHKDAQNKVEETV
jgi:hypothetical protein